MSENGEGGDCWVSRLSLFKTEVVRGFEKKTRTGEDPHRASEIAAQREVRFVERPEFCSHC